MVSGALTIKVDDYIASANALVTFADSSNYATHKTTYATTTVDGHLKAVDYVTFSSAVLH